jgi:hypothetical protein
MKTINFLTVLLSSLLTIGTVANAQESQENRPDTLTKVIENLQSDVAILKNLKITGYIQAQAQFADSVGANTSMQAGAFPANSDKRFSVRRGRLKVAYSSNPLSQFALQIDVNETGVKTKEIYAKITDPFVNFVTLTAGLQARPYGFEIEYSSGLLESPERSRTEQSLFKDEYDLGANVTIQAPKTSRFNFIKLDAGYFTGSIENNSPMDYKKNKDFIGRINLSKSFLDEKLKLSGGVSYYKGFVPNVNNQFYKVINGQFQSVWCEKNSLNTREYYGADFQVSLDNPIGMTTLRAEYTVGQQSSAKGDIKNQTTTTTYSYNSATNTVTSKSGVLPSDILYNRNVEGYYIMWVQNILNTRHSFVVKYDVFDPNTKVSGQEVSAANGFSSTDVKWTDLGIGYNCRLDANTKLLVYYDFNKNEKSGISGLSKDLKDNVWTIRLQYKF